MEVDLRRVRVDSLLRGLSVQAVREGDEWRARCPSGRHSDNKPSWSIKDDPHHDKHAVHGCFSCHYAGNAITLARDLMGLAGLEVAREWVRANAYDDSAPEVARVSVEVEPLTRKPFALPKEVVLEFDLALWPSELREYAISRNLDQHSLIHWGLGYALGGKLAGRIVIPIKNASKQVISYTARAALGQPARYITASLAEGGDPTAVFGEEHWSYEFSHTIEARVSKILGGDPLYERGVKTVFVCEGAFNAMAVEQVWTCSSGDDGGDAYGCPVAALGGSKLLPGQALRLARFSRFIVLTDADPAGDDAASQLEQAFGRRAEVVRVGLPKGQDPASMDRDELKRLLREVY